MKNLHLIGTNSSEKTCFLWTVFLLNLLCRFQGFKACCYSPSVWRRLHSAALGPAVSSKVKPAAPSGPTLGRTRHNGGLNIWGRIWGEKKRTPDRKRLFLLHVLWAASASSGFHRVFKGSTVSEQMWSRFCPVVYLKVLKITWGNQ